MANREFCRHYRAAAYHTHCEAGIEMRRVADPAARPLRLPCYDPTAKHLCDQHEHFTEAEIAETNAILANYVAQITGFGNGATRTCPDCGAQVEHIDLYEKSEPDTYSLYVQPCGHRLGLWSKAPQWAVDAGIVTIIRTDMEGGE